MRLYHMNSKNKAKCVSKQNGIAGLMCHQSSPHAYHSIMQDQAGEVLIGLRRSPDIINFCTLHNSVDNPKPPKKYKLKFRIKSMALIENSETASNDPKFAVLSLFGDLAICKIDWPIRKFLNFV